MSAEPSPGGGRFGRFEILVAERRLLVDGQPVALGSRAFDLLAALVARRDRVVPKDELIDVVWPGLVVEDNNLQVQVSALRKALGADAIATVAGRGYQLTVAAAAQGAAAPAPPARAHGRAEDRAAGRGRLLVADDNKVNRLLLCRSLELMGHDVASAEDGRAALEKLRGERFDLLLLDLEMPGLDGFGLLEARAADPALREVPVIVTSSLEGVAAVARCIELGADDYLRKPVNPVLLKARVESSLERKQLRDRQRELLARLAPGLDDAAPAAAGAARALRAEATLLVARLRDVDAVATGESAEAALELLSDWTTLMIDAVEAHGGRVRQTTGDGLTATFGVPEPVPAEGGAAFAAARAAAEMRELVIQFNAERSVSAKTPIGVGIGIASGEVLAGYAGSQRLGAYVCVGATARRATRLEALASERGGDAILIDAATHAALAGRTATDPVPAAGAPGAAAAVHALRPSPR